MDPALDVHVHQDTPNTETTSTLTVRLPPLPVVSELLCFIQNKIETLTQDALVQLCIDFYSFDVISAAKRLLFDTVQTKQRYVPRKGCNKAKMSMGDIVKVFLEMEVSNAPVFVARNLQDLPPIAMHNSDSTKLLSDIVAIKTQLNYITANQNELAVIYKRVTESQLLEAPASTDTGNVRADIEAADVGADVVVASDAETTPDTRSSTATDTEPATNAPSSPRARMEGGFQLVTSRTFRRQKSRQTAHPAEQPTYSEQLRRPPAVQIQKPRITTDHRRRFPTQDRGSIRQSDDVVIGQARTSLLVSAQQATQRHHGNSGNRRCTGLFVSRLAPRCTVDQLSTFVYQTTGHTVRPERLQTRYDSYSSFYIRCDGSLRRDLMDAHIWPSGALVKLFFD